MKTILTFDDAQPDDMALLKDMLNVHDWMCVVGSVAETIRDKLKYGHDYTTADEALEALRALIAEELSDRNLSLYG